MNPRIEADRLYVDIPSLVENLLPMTEFRMSPATLDGGTQVGTIPNWRSLRLRDGRTLDSLPGWCPEPERLSVVVGDGEGNMPAAGPQ